VVGLLVFVLGVGLILLAFKMAFDLFQVPPTVAVGVDGEKEINLNTTISSAIGIVVRITLLVVMAGLGSMIANRGIRLYSSGTIVAAPKDTPKPEPEP